LGHVKAPLVAAQELKMNRQQCDQVSHKLKAHGWKWLALPSFIKESGLSSRVALIARGYVVMWHGSEGCELYLGRLLGASTISPEL
ncbi:MAG: hypothetical protein ACKPKO_45710, partial [Candidatus Fonsibacter sp.]